MEFWMIGRPIIVDFVEIGWMPEGAFEQEEDASANAKEGEFIILVETGDRFPIESIDAKKLYYPNLETWEQSILYKMRQKKDV